MWRDDRDHASDEKISKETQWFDDKHSAPKIVLSTEWIQCKIIKS